MKRVTGLGGVFFKADNHKTLGEWYRRHLGIAVEDWGAVFKLEDRKEPGAYNVWSPFKSSTTYFEPSAKPFMINFVVDDLDALLEVLKQEEVNVLGKEESEFGKFGWILDPEGNKLELWEPPKS